MSERVLALNVRKRRLTRLLLRLLRPVSLFLRILFHQLCLLGHRSFFPAGLYVTLEGLVLTRLGISYIVGEQLNGLLVVLVQRVGLPQLGVLALAEHLGWHLVA